MIEQQHPTDPTPGPDWTVIASAIYPADVAEFRELWTTPNTVWWIRDSIPLLSDQEIEQLIQTLRGVYVKHPDMIMDVWHLVAEKAGNR
ncbi:hypothetical protein [Deinococcus ruber]|uniref:Uncharacterized protein n=1 Tax=Deinococcus ruber TaxID=1848197 RepID=A0A918CLF7_9DEIO|nr:hypothetical protein [Deinococcus ruber]GGR31239.1 hypothetical protein GCM10008957_47380 [Deinococcus ruber]